MRLLTTPRLVLILIVVVVSLLMIERSTEAGCEAPPISREELNAAIGGPVQLFAENVVQDQQAPVSPDVRRQVENVLGQVVTCSNAGEPLRVWSLYSDAYLARLFQIQGPFTEEQYSLFARPQPVESGDGMRLEMIDGVWQRPDGLVVAQVVTRYPSVPMPKRLLFWFTVSGDRVKIEEVTGEIGFSVP